MQNSEITKQAREALKGNWGLAVGTFFLYFLISIGIQNIPKVGWLLNLLIAGPFALGVAMFTLALSRGQHPKLEEIFRGFKNFGKALGTYLLKTLFIILWTLLLIVPGIIKSISYAMTFYILSEDQSVSPHEAIRRSSKMMDGYKWKYFKLQLRFLGWTLLSILTIGIGFLWLVPYMAVSEAKFYDDVKNRPLPATV